MYKISERRKQWEKEYRKLPHRKKMLKDCQDKLLKNGYWVHGFGRWTYLKARAKNCNLSCSITPKEFENWWKTTPENCYYCGISLVDFLSIRDFLNSYKGTNRCILPYKHLFTNSLHAKIKNMTILN